MQERFLNQEALWQGSLGILSQVTPSDFLAKIRGKTIPSLPAVGMTGRAAQVWELKCSEPLYAESG